MLTAPPPVATQYALVQPQTVLDSIITPDTITSLRREVTLQAQGEAVELFDNISPLTTALSFAAVYDISDEAVLRLSNGQSVLLFDHQPKDTLRPEEVDQTLWSEVLKIKNKEITVKDISTPKEECIIDLSALWSRVRKQNDIIANTKLFLKSFAKALEPATTVRLRGTIPNLPLLLAIYLSRPYGHIILFEDADGRSITLFSNL